MTKMNFTEEEVRGQLKSLGFESVSDEQIRRCKQELETLLDEEEEEEEAAAIGALISDPQSTSPPSSVGLLLRSCSGQIPTLSTESDSSENCEHQEPQQLKRHPRKSRSRKGFVLVEKLSPVIPEPEVESLRRFPFSSSSSSSQRICGLSSMEETLSNGATTTPSSSSSTTSVHFRKRKILRHGKNGRTFVERAISSFSSSSSPYASTSSSVSTGTRHTRNSEWFPMTHGRRSASSTRAHESREGDDKGHSATPLPKKKWKSTGDLRHKTSLRPYVTSSSSLSSGGGPLPGGPMLLKTDPVALYHFYKREWELHKAPGEKDHRQLRWNIRTMMSLKDPLPHPRSRSRSSVVST